MGTIELAKIDGRFKDLPLLYRDLSTSATDLLDIVNSTLGYRMIQAGNFEPNNTQFDPNGLIKKLVKQSYLLPNAEHLKITTNNQTPEGTELTGDAKKIMQILTNLLSNAVKFTPPGGEVSITSELARRSDATVWRVSIKDIGIDPSNLDLPVTLAKSAPNLGMVTENSLAAVPRDNLSILLVEDHPLNAEIVSEIVKPLTGKEPTVVHTAEDAIACLAENRPFDLILMDINLGAGMSGFLAKPLDPIAMRNVLLAI